MSRETLDDVWQEVKANRAKLNGCKRHHFDGGEIKKLGAKYICRHCGGTEGLSSIGDYIKGYEAAGGNADDIWPGWW